VVLPVFAYWGPIFCVPCTVHLLSLNSQRLLRIAKDYCWLCFWDTIRTLRQRPLWGKTTETDYRVECYWLCGKNCRENCLIFLQCCERDRSPPPPVLKAKRAKRYFTGLTELPSCTLGRAERKLVLFLLKELIKSWIIHMKAWSKELHTGQSRKLIFNFGWLRTQQIPLCSTAARKRQRITLSWANSLINTMDFCTILWSALETCSQIFWVSWSTRCIWMDANANYSGQ